MQCGRASPGFGQEMEQACEQFLGLLQAFAAACSARTLDSPLPRSPPWRSASEPTRAIFTVVDAVLLKPLTYPDADRIVEFLLTSPDGKATIASIPKFHSWEQQTSVFQDVAAYDFGGPGFNLTGDRPEQVHGIHVTQGYFRLFGAPVMLGRTFTPQEDSPNGGKVVVLSYGLWQRKFGGNPNIVGTLALTGQ